MIKPKINIFIKGFITVAVAVLFPLYAHAGLFDGVGDFFGGIADGIGDAVGGVTDFLGDVWGGIVDTVVGIWNFIMDLLFGDPNGCPPAALYYKNQVSHCWSCTLYETIFNAINNVATNAYNGLHAGCVKLLAVGLGLWILIFTGRYLFSFVDRKPEEYISKLFNMLFKAMVVAILLGASASTFSHYIVSPIVVTATEYGIGVMESFAAIKDDAIDAGGKVDTSSLPAECEDGVCKSRNVECDRKGNCKFTGYQTIRSEPCQRMKAGNYTDDGKILNPEIKDAFVCMINNMHYETAYVIAMSNAMLCHSWHGQKFAGILKVPSLELLITSVCILLAMLLICFTYVFKLVDVVLRLGVLMILLPVLAVAFVFPVTLDFAKKGFGLLIHIAFTFISLILVLSLALMLVTIAFTGDGAQDTLIGYFNKNEINKMKDAIDLSSLNFLFGITTMVIAIKILGLSEHIASEFSGVMIGSTVGDRFGASLAQISLLSAQGGLRTAKLFSAQNFNEWRNKRNQKKVDDIRTYGVSGRKAAKIAKYNAKAEKQEAKAQSKQDMNQMLQSNAASKQAAATTAANRAEWVSKQSEYANRRLMEADNNIVAARDNKKIAEEELKKLPTTEEAKKTYDAAQKEYKQAEKEREAIYANAERNSVNGEWTAEDRAAINTFDRKFNELEANRDNAADTLERSEKAAAKLQAAEDALQKAESDRDKIAEAAAQVREKDIKAKAEADVAKWESDQATAKADKSAAKADKASAKAERAREKADEVQDKYGRKSK